MHDGVMNMDLNSVASQDVNSSVNAVWTASAAKEKSADTKAAAKVETQPAQDQTEQSLTRDDMEKMTNEMTKFMESLNTDIQFTLHEGTGRLIVKVIDKQTDKVLKEFPPHQLLDTMAAISKYIGGLLDKKV